MTVVRVAALIVAAVRPVATLAELDLAGALGLALSSSVVADLERLDSRLDRLETRRQRNGWRAGACGRAVGSGQSLPSVLERVLSFPAAADDLFECSLTVWQKSTTTLLVEATVLVNCFCPTDHNIHQTAEREWLAETGSELRDAFDAAVTALEYWATRDPDPDSWRTRVGLPPRPRSSGSSPG